VEGIKFGSIIAITTIGLSLIFGTTGLINYQAVAAAAASHG
jgi:branched-subunit amino acid ABC-type transport system permease component